MRRQSERTQKNQPRIKVATGEIRLTTEEILSDLLYPAPAPPSARETRPKAGR